LLVHELRLLWRGGGGVRSRVLGFLGALVIIAAWVLIWIYVRWANKHYDTAIETLRGEQ